MKFGGVTPLRKDIFKLSPFIMTILIIIIIIMKFLTFFPIIAVILISCDFFCSFTDSFVNSQEWTLSRSVPDLRLGIVGSLSSGKSALVHRYLTGSYMQEESPEGGRFKKEISVDGHSHLLLIRDEGGSPELQVGFCYDDRYCFGFIF